MGSEVREGEEDLYEWPVKCSNAGRGERDIICMDEHQGAAMQQEEERGMCIDGQQCAGRRGDLCGWAARCSRKRRGG